MKQELPQLLVYLRSRAARSTCTQEFSFKDGLYYATTLRDSFPDAVDVMTLIAALPLGTAEVERVFSRLKRTLTSERNLLSDEHLEALIRVQCSGPETLSVKELNDTCDFFAHMVPNRRVKFA